MSRLSISLLGAFQARQGTEPITQFESNKARALLAYLAVESDQPHRRETLAGLLWPHQPERTARHNLSQALLSLRRAIGDYDATPPFLIITRETIQFNKASDHWLDVAEFIALLDTCEQHSHQQEEDCPPCLARFQQAMALYQGNFLEEFSLEDAAPFEEWCVLQRERLYLLATTTLQRLVRCHARRGEHEKALQYARQWVGLDPWQEEAHRQLMHLLALSGRRIEALAQYQAYQRILVDEMGIKPTAEMTRLYERIRDGDIGQIQQGEDIPRAADRTSTRLTISPSPLRVEESPSHFVARSREMEWLSVQLDLALSGRGRVVFVTGGAGWGKTTLIREFAHRAQETHPDLIVAGGNCNAYTGIGDPYLPFREILDLLSGDVEAQWRAGTITHEHAHRLWKALPLVVHALVEDGPDLIDTFVPGAALAARAATHASDGGAWLDRLQALVERKATTPNPEHPQQSDLFRQYTRVLQTLAHQAPLLLLLDDLQWADLGTISLLFHLGRRLAGSRILILGAYRSEEVTSGRGEKPHPLQPVVDEFVRHFGDIVMELGRTEDRAFVDAFLDSEPNRLGAAFRDTLYRQTGGHPLFTVELLRGMQERGDLVRDEAGRWMEGPTLDWETLPARVEATIAERISRLPEELQAILAVASVEGEEFTAEVVARVRATDEWDMVQRLSNELEKRHRLVRAQGIQRVGDRRLSRYRFRHHLFQRYLYNRLDEVERVTLHEEVGYTLEELYGDQAGEICVSLARHFEEARIADKAVEYLRQAGERAVRLSAHEEAIAHFTKALSLLETLPEGPEHTRQELALQVLLGNALLATKGYTAPEVGECYARARVLCRQAGETPQLFPVLHGLHRFYLARAELQTSRDLAEQCLELAHRQADPSLLVPAYRMMGTTLFFLGEFAPALEHFERGIALYDAERHRPYALLCGQDEGVGCRGYSAWALWDLGYPDQALARSREALTLAQTLSHPYSLAYALVLAAWLRHFRREAPETKELAEAAIDLSAKRGFAFWWTFGTVLRGWALMEQGQVEAGTELISQGLDATRSMGIGIGRPHALSMLAEARAKAGQIEEALALLDEALATAHENGEACSFADLYRLKGEHLLALSDENQAEAEACFRQAIKIARQRSAKLVELRTVTSLSRLWWSQGKSEKARQLLAQAYGWFTEGFDIIDLKEAKALLDALS